MKPPRSSPSEFRLLAAAVGASILVHAAAIGGWAILERARPGSSSPAGQATEVKVRLVSAAEADPSASPMPDFLEEDAGSGAADAGRVSTERADRVRSRTAVERAVPARRLLSDPVTGLIFSAYFKAVKARLAQEAAAAHAGFEDDVTVHFVLSRTGGLEAVLTPPGTSDAVRDAVLRLFSAATPFPPFPPSIQHASIAFEVLFRRDASVLR